MFHQTEYVFLSKNNMSRGRAPWAFQLEDNGGGYRIDASSFHLPAADALTLFVGRCFLQLPVSAGQFTPARIPDYPS
jgi:hypothetical protein